MGILEHIRNSTPYRVFANGSSEGPLSNRDRAGSCNNFRVKTYNFQTIDFLPKIYENSLDDEWPFW